MRRAANPTRKISITIQNRTFQELERVLSYADSRSRYIDTSIQMRLDGSKLPTVSDSTTNQLMAALYGREDVDETLKAMLLHLLS